MKEITKYLTEKQLNDIQDAKDDQDFDKEYSHQYDRFFVGVCLNPECDWTEVTESARMTKNRTYHHDDTDLHGNTGGHYSVWDRADQIENKISFAISDDSPTPRPEDYPNAGNLH
jgi:hypothetical protein